MAAHERAEAHNFEENCTWLGVFRPGHQQRKIAEILEQAADLVAAAQQPDQRAPGVRGQATLYVCRIDHPNDVIAAENIMEAMKLHGIGCRLIELGSKGYRPELQQCLRDPHAIGALGLNFQLDRSWSSEGTSFLDEASARRLPVVQWMLDHVSARWPQFTKSTAANSAYLFLSPYNENYFRRFILPDALTASTFSIGPNRRSRTEDFSVESYRERSIKCLIPINLRRLGDGKRPRLEELRQSDPALHDAVSAAIEAARGDLLNPIEDHFLAALEAQGLAPPLTVFNSCVQVVDELTQEWRRRYVFEVARAYPVLIDTDVELPAPKTGASATFIRDSHSHHTINRLISSRAVVSVSNLGDMMHDRTLNGMNAGCANIVEDNAVHRRVFKDGVDALFFRYDDDSLRDCLDLVCNDPERAYVIAAAGSRLRDQQPFKFGDFAKIIELASALRVRNGYPVMPV